MLILDEYIPLRLVLLLSDLSASKPTPKLIYLASYNAYHQLVKVGKNHSATQSVMLPQSITCCAELLQFSALRFGIRNNMIYMYLTLMFHAGNIFLWGVMIA